MAFNSGLEVVKGAIDGKLVLKLAAGSAELGALLGIKLGKVSEPRIAEGARGKVEGKVDGAEEVGMKLRELVLTGSKGDGISGKAAGKVETGKFEAGRVEPGRFEAPVGKGALKLGYCSGCCIEGGMASPGGGRSKDCWCKCGSPFGGP